MLTRSETETSTETPETPERRWLPATRVAVYAITVILVVLGFVLLWRILDVLFLLFLSILLATAIEPIVNRLRRGPFSKGQGILIVYILIIALLAGLVFLTVPPLVDEGTRFATDFPKNLDNLRGWATTNLPQPIRNSVLSVLGSNDGTAPVPQLPSSIGGDALNVGLSFVGSVFSFVTVFVIAFYWLTERPTIKRAVIALAPRRHRQTYREVWDAVEEKLGGWVRGQLTLMVFIGVADAIAYSIIGVHFALVLAVFAGIAEIIPIVGPYIGGAPAILVALTQGTQTALIVAVYIVVIQLVEGNLLVPRIMERSVGVSPLTVIVGILIGSTLAGIAGALIAVPIAAAIQVTITTLTTRSAAADAQTTPALATPHGDGRGPTNGIHTNGNQN